MTVVWSYDRQRQGLCGSLVSDYFRNTHLSDPTPIEEQMRGVLPDQTKARGFKGRIPANKTPPKIEQRIVRLAAKGWSKAQIARDVGIGWHAVFHVLKRTGAFADHRTRLREKAA